MNSDWLIVHLTYNFGMQIQAYHSGCLCRCSFEEQWERACVFSFVHSRWGCFKQHCDRIVQRVELSECKSSVLAQGRISAKLLFGWDRQRSWETTAEEGHDDLCLCQWKKTLLWTRMSQIVPSVMSLLCCWIRSAVVAGAAPSILNCMVQNIHDPVRMDWRMVL